MLFVLRNQDHKVTEIPEECFSNTYTTAVLALNHEQPPSFLEINQYWGIAFTLDNSIPHF